MRRWSLALALVVAVAVPGIMAASRAERLKQRAREITTLTQGAINRSRVPSPSLIPQTHKGHSAEALAEMSREELMALVLQAQGSAIGAAYWWRFEQVSSAIFSTWRITTHG